MKTTGAIRHSLTAQGWITIAAGVALCITIILPNRPMVFALGIGCLLALVIASLFVPRRIRDVQARWMLPARIHAGEETTIGVSLATKEGAPPCTLGAYDPNAEQTVYVTDLPGLGVAPTRVAWLVRFPRRGLVKLPPPILRCDQPFGLVTQQRQVGSQREIVVLPTIGKVQRELIEQLNRWLEDGELSDQKGDDELAHLREYRPGDPLRRIHWRASARARHLVVSERQAQAAQRIALYVDSNTRNPNSRRFERLISMAATIIDHLDRSAWHVTLHGAFLNKPLSGDRDELLEALAIAAPQADASLQDAIPHDQACLALMLRDEHALPDHPRVMPLPLNVLEEMIALPRTVK